MKRVLFVCVENAGRSQMAEAFARRYGAGKVEAESAGTMPCDGVNPTVVEAMKEKGIDISKAKPKPLTMKMIKEADVVVTMGCGAEDVCPAPLWKDVIEWQLKDPKEKPIEQVRRIRDAIEAKVLKLIAKT